MGYNARSKATVIKQAGKFLSGYVLVSEYLIKIISKTVITSLFDMNRTFQNTIILQFTKAADQSKQNHPTLLSSNNKPGSKSVKRVIKPSVDEGL